MNFTNLPTNHANTSFESDNGVEILGISLIGVFLTVVMLVGIVGNIMVLVAVGRERKLHTRANYLIGSLAVTDLLVSALVLPWATVITYMFEIGEPPLGSAHRVICTLFVFLDVACCTASILHLCVIAWVRYKKVSTIQLRLYPRTFKSVIPTITCIWSTAVILSMAPFLMFSNSAPTKDDQTQAMKVFHNSTSEDIAKTTSDEGRCIVNDNKIYRAVATTVAFFAPLIAIIIIYVKVAHIGWSVLRHKNSSLRSKDRYTNCSQMRASEKDKDEYEKINRCSPKSSGTDTPATRCNQRMDWYATTIPKAGVKNNILESSPQHHISPLKTENNIDLNETQLVLCDKMIQKWRKRTSSLSSNLSTPRKNVVYRRSVIDSPSINLRDVIHQKYTKKRKRSHSPTVTVESDGIDTRTTTILRRRMKRERKIIQTLGMVIGAFVICWLPFFLKEVILPFCSTCSLPPAVEITINELGYFNSVLNPLIYACTNTEFNNAFRQMFSLKKIKKIFV